MVKNLGKAQHRVFIDQTEKKVNCCRVSAYPFNIWWQGRQRPLEQSEEASFLSFEFQKPVQVCVIAERPFHTAAVRPLSAGIAAEIKGNEICFSIDKPGQYVVETDDDHHALHLFADAARDYADMGEPNIVFGPGKHRAEKIVLKDGDRVYIDKDAVVYGSFYGKNVKNVRIFGGGIVDGGWETRRSMHCYEDYTNGCIKFYESSDIQIEGIVLRDSAIWVLNLFDCEDVSVNNVKIVGHYKYNTDGIDIVNSRRVRITNSFIRAFDDAITLKGIVQYCDKSVEDILVENCVLWCGWGRTLELGLETVAPAFRRLTFRNCDLIHNSAVALDIQTGDYAVISDVLFEDIRVEYQPYTLPEIIQSTPDKEYDGYGKTHVPLLFSVENPYYLINDDDYREYDRQLEEVRKGKVGGLKNCRLVRVRAVGESGEQTPAVRVELNAPFDCDCIDISGLVIFGKPVHSLNDCLAEGNGKDKLCFR